MKLHWSRSLAFVDERRPLVSKLVNVIQQRDRPIAAPYLRQGA